MEKRGKTENHTKYRDRWIRARAWNIIHRHLINIINVVFPTIGVNLGLHGRQFLPIPDKRKNHRKENDIFFIETYDPATMLIL